MNGNLKQLVLGFDFSAGARAALAVSHQLAVRDDAALTVVTAAPGAVDERVIAAVEGRPLDEQRQRLEDDFLHQLGEYVRAEVRREIPESDVAITYHVGLKEPARMLLEVAHEVQADVILVGAAGNRTPSRGHEVGEDVERLVRVSSRPVWAVRPGVAFPPSNVLCPVDFSPACVKAFAWAVDAARMGSGCVELLHVIPADLGLGDVSSFFASGYRKALHTIAERELTEFLARVDTSGVVLTVTVVDGMPADAILERLREGRHDLVALGTLGRSEQIQLLIGSTAERVIRGAPASILAAPPDRPQPDQVRSLWGEVGKMGAPAL